MQKCKKVTSEEGIFNLQEHLGESVKDYVEMKKAAHWFELNFNYFFLNKEMSCFAGSSGKWTKQKDFSEIWWPSASLRHLQTLVLHIHLHYIHCCVSHIIAPQKCLWEFKELSTDNLHWRHSVVECVIAKLDVVYCEIMEMIILRKRLVSFHASRIICSHVYYSETHQDNVSC